MHPDLTHVPLSPGLSHTFEPALPLKEEGGERTEVEKGQKCGGQVEGRGRRDEEKEEQEQ